ncbi:serpin family protein [Alkaliphilus pronyensis]|uniref:Serpin family protein n=1 Tax=Alkaliphilus pronyensis TaxID=1482732 RepID=A0A6I0EZV4_9FIRM|nr:serpin family protein [Alkaliphilus pronyensis]KAB3535518.1 serpin family protein [Alkaliphilus pronyensis]
MRRLSLILVILMVISLAACNGITDTDVDNIEYEKIDEKLISGNTEFAFDIFKEANKEDQRDNVFISPISISTALSMTYQGAKGATKEGMAEALNYKEIETDKLNNSYRELLKYLENIDSKVELNISNSIWARKGEAFNKAFLDVNKEVFNAHVTDLDFSDANAANTINDWIKDATNEKIDKMINPPIPQNVLMYLINAIYFKGEWTNEFQKDRTFDGKFYSEDGNVRDIKMMSRNDSVEYGEGDGFKAVKLPYGNGKTAMYCILPNENTSINSFIEDLDANKWRDIRESISEKEDVVLQIPRFKLEYGIKELNDSLTNLGMGEAFTGDADFSDIREGIFINKVYHKAVIEVNEEGSEAAAVTVVEMAESAAMDQISFIANRPFIFIIAEEELGTVLFMGKLLDIK